MTSLKKWEDSLQFTAFLWAIILLNIWATDWVLRWDLTEDKRYTISQASQQVLENLDEVVFVEVYLEGDLNSAFTRLQKSVRETLEQFRVYGKQKIQYRFVNPDAGNSEAEKRNFYQQLVNKGIQPTQLYDNVDGKKVQKIIFPYALISYKQKEVPVLLLKGNKTATAQEQLNQSIEGLEYELASSIEALTQKRKKNIGIINGHQELYPQELQDLQNSLQQKYAVDQIGIDEQSLKNYDALLIAQPKKAFDEAQKYYLDQYIMNGGKALFLIDMVQMNLDSIALGGAYAFAYDLNLSDLLFRYGVRLNMDLLQDQEMGSILVNVGNLGNRPNLQPIPFPYYIQLNTFGKHPIVRNLNGVYGRFVGSLDTVKADKVRKTPLVMSNRYTRIKKIPSIVSLNELKEELDSKLFKSSKIPVAYLLEGNFTSMFKNRFPPEGIDNQGFIEESKETKIVVFADGDLAKNEFDPKTGQALPLGFDKITRQTYSNKDFILNTFAYLLDDNGLILSRNNEVLLRPLDKVRIQAEKTGIQVLNMVLPILLVLIFGIARYFWRKRSYES